MDHKFPGTEIETKIMQHLVAALGGHAVTIVRPGVGGLLGFSVKGRTVVVRDMLEDAGLSTDAEPVAWRWRSTLFTEWNLSEKPPIDQLAMERETEMNMEGLEWQALYAEPVKTAPAVAVKATIGSRMQGMVRSIEQYRNGDPKVIMSGSEAQALYALQDARHDILVLWDIAFNALSAQVQDVADTETFYTTEMDDVWDFAAQSWANADLKITVTASPAPKHGEPEKYRNPDIFHDAEGRN